jgi:general secretion pathway protein F
MALAAKKSAHLNKVVWFRASAASSRGDMAREAAKAIRKARTLRDDQRAALFQGLARTASAGLDAVQALNAIRDVCKGTLSKPLAAAAQAVGSGTAMLHALERNGLISAHDRPALANAESSGALPHAYEQLAQRYQRAAARWRQLKGKLLLPAALLVMAIILLPIPALFAGKLTLGDYLLRSASMLMLVMMLGRLAAMLITHWRAHGTPGWLTRIARILPIVEPMSHLHQRADTSERLALALRCGSAANDTLKLMIRGEHNTVRKHALAGVRKDLGAGATLATALQHYGLLDATGFAIVSTGESAGKLDDSLQRAAQYDHDTLDGRYGLLAQWLPVFVYAGVAGSVVVGLLG